MTNATILREAEVELWEAVAYYEERAAGLGLDLAAEFERSIQAICESPKRWPLRKDGTRRYLTRRFPFVIVYTYHRDHMWIIAIAHCKRRPEYWTDRIQRGRE